MELNEIIAGNIYNLRNDRGMTQTELAEKLNYTDKLVSKWERGEAIPNAYTLKQISEIFSVSMDYIFSSHEDEAVPKETSVSRKVITAISIMGIWTVDVLVFVILWITLRPMPSILFYAVPASIVTLLVLNSVWNKGKHNYMIIAALVASIAATVYIALLKFNCWQIFILLIPAELVVLLCAKLKIK